MRRVNKGTDPVASRAPNSLGIYDMLGNVWEWCNDFNDPDRDTISSFVQPAGPSWGPERVLRGGSYVTIQGHWSRSFRSSIRPDYKSRYTGFRVVRNSSAAESPAQPVDESWLQTFNQIPEEFQSNVGDLSSLTDDERGTPIVTASDWEERRAALKTKWETLLGVPSSNPSPPDVKLIRNVSNRHYTGRLMYLRTEPDSWEKIFLMIPARAVTEPTPTVIVPYYDVDTPAGENLGGRSFRPPSVRSFAHLLVRQGYIALAVRWFGESYGENYNEAVANLKSRHPRCTGLGKWVWDARRVVDFLCTLPEVDQDRIGIIGHSLGAKMTLYAAAMDERIDVAVFSEGGIGLEFSNYEDYWYWGETIKNVPERTDHHELLGLIAPRPFLLIGGDDADNDKSWHFINAAREVYEIYDRSESIGYFNHRTGHSPTPESVHLALEWFKFFFDR
jgi:pimeloyl-ACP methyl ester carboxylesterase